MRWLVGEERGCLEVCHCRPSALQARRVLALIHWVVCGHELVCGAVDVVLSSVRSTVSILRRGDGDEDGGDGGE